MQKYNFMWNGLSAEIIASESCLPFCAHQNKAILLLVHLFFILAYLPLLNLTPSDLLVFSTNKIKININDMHNNVINTENGLWQSRKIISAAPKTYVSERR